MDENLPDNWVSSSIADVADILDNLRKPVSSVERAKRIGNIPYYGATGLAGYIDNFIFDEELILLGEDGAPFFDKSKNVAFKIEGKSWVNNHAHVLRAKFQTRNDFLLHYLNQFNYEGFVGGTTRLKLTQGDLKKIPFPLPPLAEQERIVAKVDKLFAQIGIMKKALERIPRLLKDFRQQVLTQAVTGKLTEEWRDDQELNEWKIDTVKNVATKLGSGSTPKGGNNTYLSTGIPLVRSMNVVFGGIKLDGLAFISDVQANALKNVEIQFNDILLNITGASIGRLCLADRSVTGGRVNQHVFIIRAKTDIIIPKYLEIYMRSNLIQKFIEDVKYGAGMEAISKTQIENFEINLPPIQEQQEIVNRVESLFNKAVRIEEKYKFSKAKIENLPKAILHKAFKGELVEQLPTDGEAGDLLEEIKKLKINI